MNTRGIYAYTMRQQGLLWDREGIEKDGWTDSPKQTRSAIPSRAGDISREEERGSQIRERAGGGWRILQVTTSVEFNGVEFNEVESTCGEGRRDEIADEDKERGGRDGRVTVEELLQTGKGLLERSFASIHSSRPNRHC